MTFITFKKSISWMEASMWRGVMQLVGALTEQSPRGLVCLIRCECISASFQHPHGMKGFKKLPFCLTVLMHYDDTPTTDCRPSKKPI